MTKIRSLGVMSGSSCDGLDLALCAFQNTSEGWKFTLEEATTIPLSSELKGSFQSQNIDGQSLAEIDVKFGAWIGARINAFLKKFDKTTDLISSHGHTIYHQPENGFGFQAGSGAVIAAVTGIDTVSDFRTADLALGGQGAPLVPVGDLALFSDYDLWLNLGGIANITCRSENEVLAFDVAPCNMVLNHLAQKVDLEFDRDGKIASSGTIQSELLNSLSGLPYFEFSKSKSLGREWVYDHYIPLIEDASISLEDAMATAVSHIALELQKVIQNTGNDDAQLKMLCTGGGAFNNFLISEFSKTLKVELVLPDNDIVNFKEAIIFAFLGVLRSQNKTNIIGSVTGSNVNHSAGRIDKGSCA